MHPLARTGVAVAALGALGGAFLAGVSVGSSVTVASPPVSHRPTGGGDLKLVNADLRRAQSCDALLKWYVDQGVQRVTAYGWEQYMRIYTMADTAAGTPQPTAEATSSATGTNVQEAGVDEPDVVKSDGSVLVRVADGSTLEVYDVTGAEPARMGSLDLGDMYSPELLLAGDRVVVVGNDAKAAHDRTAPGSQVLVVDIANASAPTVVSHTTYDSSLVTARQHGNVVRLVVSTSLPELDFVQPGLLRGDQKALERNQDIVRASTIDDWLPHVTTVGADGSTTDSLVDCADVAIPAVDTGLGTVAVVGFDVADPAVYSSTAVTTPSDTVYVSADHLYLASGAYRFGWEMCCWDGVTPGGPMIAGGAGGPVGAGSDEGMTYLYDFDLAGVTATYAASGRVDGWVASRWSMDEHDGVLRLAVGPTTRTGNFNSIITLSRSGSDLVEEGRVDKLGVGEQIQSVRWFDDLAVVVTFRQTDPFYAVDLSDPADPELLGLLKVPGFSSYLHPIDGDLMIGMGSAASPETGAVNGAKAALYDVSDLTAPRELDGVEYPSGTTAQAGLDPRQFTWLPDRRTALTVISAWNGAGQTGYVSVLHVGDGSLTNRLVEVEYGVEVAEVRLVPLPDGRVVLSTGDKVSFFHL